MDRLVKWFRRGSFGAVLLMAVWLATGTTPTAMEDLLSSSLGRSAFVIGLSVLGYAMYVSSSSNEGKNA